MFTDIAMDKGAANFTAVFIETFDCDISFRRGLNGD
jgi:hypothetical protein